MVKGMRNISREMTCYVNSKTCRRNTLFSDYEGYIHASENHPMCCDIIMSKKHYVKYNKSSIRIQSCVIMIMNNLSSVRQSIIMTVDSGDTSGSTHLGLAKDG